MGDGEAFTWFLGGRIHKILFDSTSLEEYGRSGLLIEYAGKSKMIEEILYKYFRCALQHEAALPDNVGFVEYSEPFNGGTSVAIQFDGRLLLGREWFDVITQAVVYAQINGEEFGIKHRVLRSRNNVDDAVFADKLSEKYDVTPGRIEILKSALLKFTGVNIHLLNEEEVKSNFQQLIFEGDIALGDLNALERRGVVDEIFALTVKGVCLIKELALEYETFEI